MVGFSSPKGPFSPFPFLPNEKRPPTLLYETLTVGLAGGRGRHRSCSSDALPLHTATKLVIIFCRDALKKRVEELLAELCQGAPADRVAVPSAATLNFFGKTSATVGTSGEAVSAQARAPPTTALRNGWTSSTAGTIGGCRDKGRDLLPHSRLDQFHSRWVGGWGNSRPLPPLLLGTA